MRRFALALALTAVLAGSAVGVGAAAAAAKTAQVRIVTVYMTEFHFRFVKTAAPLRHGVPILFKVVNRGRLLHNFDIQGVRSSRIIGPGKTTLLRVTFRKAGRYPYLCDVPRHAEEGMAGTLVVR